jgi:hypothetical protein
MGSWFSKTEERRRDTDTPLDMGSWFNRTEEWHRDMITPLASVAATVYRCEEDDRAANRYGVYFCPKCCRYWPVCDDARCVWCGTPVAEAAREGTFPPYRVVFKRLATPRTMELLMGYIGMRPHVASQIVDEVGIDDRQAVIDRVSLRIGDGGPEAVFHPAVYEPKPLHRTDGDTEYIGEHFAETALVIAWGAPINWLESNINEGWTGQRRWWYHYVSSEPSNVNM